MQGTVKWYSSEKGYGFVTSDKGEDHYFNVKDINGATLPSNGDSVQFDSKPSDKCPRAFNLKIIAKAPSQTNRPADDRIKCPSCGRQIVPRIITNRGTLDHSVCPFCGTCIEDFNDIRNFIAWLYKLITKNPTRSLIIGATIFILISFSL
jgi:cold shock CspA family protein